MRISDRDIAKWLRCIASEVHRYPERWVREPIEGRRYSYCAVGFIKRDFGPEWRKVKDRIRRWEHKRHRWMFVVGRWHTGLLDRRNRQLKNAGEFVEWFRRLANFIEVRVQLRGYEW